MNCDNYDNCDNCDNCENNEKTISKLNEEIDELKQSARHGETQFEELFTDYEALKITNNEISNLNHYPDDKNTHRPARLIASYERIKRLMKLNAKTVRKNIGYCKQVKRYSNRLVAMSKCVDGMYL